MTTNLPARRDVVIREAFVMTMDPALGDFERGDVLIRNGRIAAVAARVDDSAAQVIDGRDMIVLPGFVDTHTHLWTSQMRGRFGDTRETIYFRTRNRLAEGYTAQDMFHGSRLGAAECVFSGITTAVDFCHNTRGETFASACLEGLAQAGLRTRFLFGATTTMAPAESIDLQLLDRLAGSWMSVVGDAPLTLGLAWRGPLGVTAVEPGRSVSPALDVARKEFETARALGLPISVHVSGVNAPAQFDALVRGSFLGEDVQLIHMSNATTDQLRAAAAAKSPIALTPFTELRVGYGMTFLGDFLDSGARVGLGIDSTSLGGSADMFGLMKLCQLIEAGRKKDELAMPARRLLELATLEGARSLGMDSQVGSITPGKRADVIMVDTRAINLGMFADDPAHLLVESARPNNVDTVIVDGRVLKRHGKLTALDAEVVVDEARQSMRNVIQRLPS